MAILETLKACPQTRPILLELFSVFIFLYILDILIVDAFSGDAIPAHLATQEAFEIYRKHVKPDGILAIHITNTYLNLFPIVRSLAEHNHWKWTRIFTPYESRLLLNRADWMLLTNNQAFLYANPISVPKDHWLDKDKQVTLWTDHFSNLFEVLIW